MPMPPRLLALAHATRGFLPDDEGLALHRLAHERLPHGPVLEVGSYCGKSALYLGTAAREAGGPGGIVFSVDHHRGSEENQADWEHHDPSLVDPRTGRMDTLPAFRKTMEAAGLEDVVVGLVGDSATIAQHWRTPLSLLFVDGGHGAEPAHADYQGWARWVMPDGLLAIHDVFPDPADGGRPPYEIYLRALDGGSFTEVEVVGSLRVLRRMSGASGEGVG
jgi:MMP 1-O-methyltransferase